MLTRSVQIILMLTLVALGSVCMFAQCIDETSPFTTKKEIDEVPRGVRESCIKLRIAQAKKDHEEMIERGEELLRLSERLEMSVTKNGRLSDLDRSALETVEKNAKKIRSELGGDDNDEKLDDILPAGEKTTLAVAIDTLKNTAADLADELKKTTRFTISATAIETSNAVLTLARFLRIKN